ncbi:hypothetical protein Leryth_006274 [Lithospermum erythrorhizon]|nr:hypothetical protein Leryth_006274 [Lithospermum erythrorhizon]
MMYRDEKKKEGNKCLVTIRVEGSNMSYKLVVKKKERVEALICKVLRSHHLEGRLPTLGLKASNFVLNPRNGIQAPNDREKIGLVGSRSFVLSKKLEEGSITVDENKLQTKKWKAWLKKYLNLKILSH